jgi:hypothetical protein
MNKLPLDDSAKKSKGFWLEKVTAFVLFMVILSLVWMVTVAYQPTWFRVFSSEFEVLLTTVLLLTSLGLVSVVALLHTRS